jgi:ATP-dependent DNA ligase
MSYLPPAGRAHYAQLAKNLDAIPEKKRVAMFPGYMSPKLDGVFMFAVCIGGSVTFLSRTGEIAISMKGTQIERDIQQIHVSSWTDFVLVGEFYHPDMEQAETSGIFRKQQEGYAEGCQFHVHDKLTLQEFEEGRAIRDFLDRTTALTVLLSGIPLMAVCRVQQYRCSDEPAFKQFAAGIQKHGGEGGIYRPFSAAWIAGDRSTNLVRIKQEISYDLLVTGVTEVKEGPKGGLLGAIQVRFRRFADPLGETITVDVRGMDHDQLREWSENPALIVGKIVKVAAMRLTNKGSLREPRFKEVRFDKDIPDL